MQVGLSLDACVVLVAVVCSADRGQIHAQKAEIMALRLGRASQQCGAVQQEGVGLRAALPQTVHWELAAAAE